MQRKIQESMASIDENLMSLDEDDREDIKAMIPKWVFTRVAAAKAISEEKLASCQIVLANKKAEASFITLLQHAQTKISQTAEMLQQQRRMAEDAMEAELFDAAA